VFRQLIRGLGVAVACAALLVACGGEDEEAPEEPVVDPEPTPDPPEEPDPAPEPVPVDPRPRSRVTGEPVDQDVLDRPLLLVKIENSPQARPQSGLEAADIVYEEVVEGGVTRFFALFHAELPEVVGPIRSARPVDTQLMSGYGRSGFAYSGARAEVQRMLAQTPSIRVTEGGPGFYRDRSRSAPHNLYLDAEATHAGVVARGAQSFRDVRWTFDQTPPSGALRCTPEVPRCSQPGQQIAIAMSRWFTTGWEYDEPAGVYRRTQNGAPFVVTGPGRIGAANVVILATRHYVGPTGYPETDVTTSGADALVLRDGQRYAARWSKPTPTDPLTVTTPEGRPFPFKPGPTWVHLPAADRMPSLAD